MLTSVRTIISNKISEIITRFKRNDAVCEKMKWYGRRQ